MGGKLIFNLSAFQCETPVIGQTFRHIDTWQFNWQSKWDEYTALGLTTHIRLYYTGDGGAEQEYTSQTLPANANSFSINLVNYDTADFRLVFDIEEESMCTFTFTIPNSSVINN